MNIIPTDMDVDTTSNLKTNKYMDTNNYPHPKFPDS